MKIQKTIALVSAIALSAGMLSACGGGESATTTTAAGGTTAAPAATTVATTNAAGDTDATAAEQGKVVNIYCWNTEFSERMAAYYEPNSTMDDSVTINYVQTPSDGGAYQTKLDQVLPANESAAADEKVDLFLIEADYALKYVETEYALPISDLGISAADLGDQYLYTQQIVTDSNGVLKGTSWQACPSLLIYKRAIAKQVLGSDDPAEVQKAVSDWATFEATAKTMKDSGYAMVAGQADTFRMFSNNADKTIFVGTTISIPDAWMTWVDQTKTFFDEGYNLKAGQWGDVWGAGMTTAGTVFCYNGPAWLINFSFKDYGATDGDWGVTEGPAPSYWGGTWICAAKGGDNAAIVKDIMLTLTGNKDVMVKLSEETLDYANNKAAMEELAASDFKADFLAGQNPYTIYAPAAAAINVGNTLSPYGQLAEDFQNAMTNYFEGAATKEEAVAAFYSAAIEKYPELTQG